MTTDISPAAIRAHFAAIDLPGGIVNMGPAEYIFTVPEFLDTQIQRLESPSPYLRRASLDALIKFAKIIGHPLPEE